MNREIKFRVWFPNHDKMWFTDMFHMKHLIRKENRKDYPIMQYTGLKDKFGKEIYEGDILEFYDASYDKWISREVYFDTEMLGFGLRQTNSLFHCQFSSEFELKGNIYENPELLRKED